MLSYSFKPFLGRPLYAGSEPFQKVVNNGCIIETQSAELVRKLKENEAQRGVEVIDWYLFKPGKTILTDSDGPEYGCTMNNGGHWIQLVEIIKSDCREVQAKPWGEE